MGSHVVITHASFQLTAPITHVSSTQIKSYESKIASQSSSLAAVGGEVKRVQAAAAADRAALEVKMEAAKASVAKATEDKKKAEAGAVRARQEIGHTHARTVKLEARISTASESELAVVNSQLEATLISKSSLQSENLKARAWTEAAAAQATNLQGELAVLGTQLEDTRASRAALEAENAQARSTGEAAASQAKALEGELASVSSQLSSTLSEKQSALSSMDFAQTRTQELEMASAPETPWTVMTNTLRRRAVTRPRSHRLCRSTPSPPETRGAGCAVGLPELGPVEQQAVVLKSQVQFAESQAEKMGAHLERVEADLEAVQKDKFQAITEFEELSDLHSKLEVTAKVLKDNQEASARELINQQAKLREASSSAEKQKEKAAHYKAEAEKEAFAKSALLAELDAVMASASQMQQALSSANAENAQLADQVNDAVNEAAALLQQLAQSNTVAGDVQDQLHAAAAESSRLKLQLTAAVSSQGGMARELEEAAGERVILLQQVSQLQSAVAEGQQLASELEAAVSKRDSLASELASTEVQLEEAKDSALKSQDSALSSMDAVVGLEQEVKHLTSELSMAQALKPQVDALQSQLDRSLQQLIDMQTAAAAPRSSSLSDGEDEQPRSSSSSNAAKAASSPASTTGAGAAAVGLTGAPKRRSAAVKSASAKTGGAVAPKEPRAPKAKPRKPEWVRLMEEDAEVDEDVAKVLKGTDGDPERIRERMKEELQNYSSLPDRGGVSGPPSITFREVNTFRLWVWMRFARPALEEDKEMLQSVVRSWFLVGKLGGYNGQNLQVYNGNSEDQSYFDYENLDAGDSMSSLLHEVGDVEYKGLVGAPPLDVLLNLLVGYSRDLCGIDHIFVGGDNEEWRVPEEEEDNGPEVSINPMRLPSGVDEELELLDDIQEMQRQQDDEDDEDLDEETLARRFEGAGELPEYVIRSEKSQARQRQRREDEQVRQPGMKLYSKKQFAEQFRIARMTCINPAESSDTSGALVVPRRPTVALALGAGGAKGLAHIGAIEEIEAQGFEIVAIAGCSMGALIGGIYAMGKLDLYRDWVSTLVKFDVLKLLDWTFSGGGFIKGERIMGTLLELIGDTCIEELPFAYTAVATDLEREREVWLTRGSLFDAIRASIAIPTVFRPYRLNGRVLVDGALLNPLPVSPLIRETADYMMAVSVDGPAEFTPVDA
ncbi:MAG: hypothetical protein WDW38_005976 [Sanguina aurantia]